MDVKERFKQIRVEQGLNQSNFAKKIGLSQANVTDIERGRGRLREETISSLYTEFSVNLAWLLTGEGPMFLPAEEEAQARPSLDDLVATKDDLQTKADKEELGELDSRLRGNDKRLEARLEAKADRVEVRGLCRKLEELRELVHEHHPPEELREVELLYCGVGAFAGPAGQADYLENRIRVLVPKRIRITPDMFVVRIIGSSMSEVIADGGLVLLRPAQQPISGLIYIMNINGENTIKKYRIDDQGQRLLYLDGSGHAIYPDVGDVWRCLAQFIHVAEEVR